MIETPRACRRVICSKSISTSRAVSIAVGSSRISTWQSPIRCGRFRPSADARYPIRRPACRIDRVEPYLRHGFDGCLTQLLAADPAAVARQVVEKQVLRYRQCRQQIEFLHDHAHAEIFSLGTAARAIVFALNCICPVVGVTRPPMIFDRVLYRRHSRRSAPVLHRASASNRCL